MPDNSALELNAVVTQRSEVAPGLIIIRVVPDGWELPDFTPGQYGVLAMPGSAPRCRDSEPDEEPVNPNKLIKRAYSIASSSRANEYLEFYVALVHSGALTPRLFALNIGDRVWLGKKIVGMFTLQKAPADANLLLVATGTGIAPYMSMIRTVIDGETNRRFAVVHGARHSWDLGYESELLAWQRAHKQFDYIPIISRPKEEPMAWGGRAGYCQDIWKNRVIDELWGFRPTPEDTHIFLCGNPAMLEDMIELLAEEGIQEHKRKTPGQVHAEKYW